MITGPECNETAKENMITIEIAMLLYDKVMSYQIPILKLVKILPYFFLLLVKNLP